MSTAPRVAVILAGGQGTRLRPLTLHQPKGLLPVVNRPLLSYELEWLRRAGVEQVILAVGDQAEALEAGLGPSYSGVELIYRRESHPLDTAGALRFAARGVEETCWALNGDLIFDLDPEPMVALHRRRQAGLTLALRQVADTAPFGLIETDAEGHVLAFHEKVSGKGSGESTVNFGLYLLEPSLLRRIPEDEPYSNERQFFPELLAAGERVLGYLPEQPGYWADVGRLEAYLQANHDLLDGALPWLTPAVGQPAALAPDAEVLAPCELAPGVQVREGARLGPYVSAGSGVVVGEGACVADSILHPCARVGKGARLSRVVVAQGMRVPAGLEQEGGLIYHER